MIRFSLRIPDDVHRRVKALAERERRSINEQIVRMLETHPEVMEMTVEVFCEICDANGQETPATRRVLGKDTCPECAAELEASSEIGPAIWMVEVSDGAEYEGYSDANYGTVDYGAYTLGWRDREAAEAYAQRAGAEAREGFIIEVVGGSVEDALEAADISDWVGFDAA